MTEYMQRPVIALLMLAAGMAFIPLNDALFKLMSARLPLAEITFVRGVITLVILAIVSNGFRAMFGLSAAEFWQFFARGLCLVVAQVR